MVTLRELGMVFLQVARSEEVAGRTVRTLDRVDISVDNALVVLQDFDDFVGVDFRHGLGFGGGFGGFYRSLGAGRTATGRFFGAGEFQSQILLRVGRDTVAVAGRALRSRLGRDRVARRLR